MFSKRNRRKVDGETTEEYILCRSAQRREKEAAILRKKRAKFSAKLREIDASIRQRPARAETIKRRLGRWLGRFGTTERYYSVELIKDKNGQKAIGLNVEEKEVPLTWAELSHGAYLLRTNMREKDPVLIWKGYVQLTQAEEAFRISQSDLHLRPLFHQKSERVQAHILVCFLTLAMWRVLEMWMKSKGLG